MYTYIEEIVGEFWKIRFIHVVLFIKKAFVQYTLKYVFSEF